MEILGQLGIDFKIIAAQIINFLILLFLLYKFLYKPLLRQIEEGEAEMQKAQTEKQELETKQQELTKQNQVILDDAKQKSAKIIQDAEELANLIKTNATQEAQDKVNKMVEHYKSVIDSSTEKPK